RNCWMPCVPVRYVHVPTRESDIPLAVFQNSKTDCATACDEWRTPTLVSDQDRTVVEQASNRVDIRPACFFQLLLRPQPGCRVIFFSRLVRRRDGLGINIEISLPVRAEHDPDRAVCFSSDGAAHQILLGISDRERIAPLAISEILHHQLVAEF